jgi:fido (protein-threonine AMPylation protein)
MPGAFHVSLEEEFALDELLTAEEIERCGRETLLWIEAVVGSDQPRPVDIHLVRAIHFRWFETSFPADAGRERIEMVLNRKGTAAPVEGIIPGVVGACRNWNWRRTNTQPTDEADQVEFIVAEANTLAVTIYDVHPFLDGNTRATWHLRNYVLMLQGLPPLLDLADEGVYMEAWWGATAHSHDELDRIVLEELDRLS